MQYELFMKSELVTCILKQQRFLSNDLAERVNGVTRIMDQVDLFLDSCGTYLYRF